MPVTKRKGHSPEKRVSLVLQIVTGDDDQLGAVLIRQCADEFSFFGWDAVVETILSDFIAVISDVIADAVGQSYISDIVHLLSFVVFVVP